MLINFIYTAVSKEIIDSDISTDWNKININNNNVNQMSTTTSLSLNFLKYIFYNLLSREKGDSEREMKSIF